MKLLRLAVLVIILISTPAATALEISGPAMVLDGDTLMVGKTKIRLYGIDAFENGQKCTEMGRVYNCGADAKTALRRIVRGGISCSGTEWDGYGRLLATCRTVSGKDVSAALVEAGHALAYRQYSSTYIKEENEARAARRGAWRARFLAPWDFRARIAKD